MRRGRGEGGKVLAGDGNIARASAPVSDSRAH